MVGKPFREWIDAKLEERNEKLVEKREMIIELDPQIEALFKASNSVSGRFASCDFQYNMTFSLNFSFFFFSFSWYKCSLDEEECKTKKVLSASQRGSGECEEAIRINPGQACKV